MSLKSLYEHFLASPNPLPLSSSVTLHYVTTVTSFADSSAVSKHLMTQDKDVVKKKSFKVLSAVEGNSSIALEVETTLEFISSGGAYLPGLDNFIVGHVATFPITHFVHFDTDRKISQIRLSWDQASLLKQVEVIGAKNRNWPIYDAKDQIKMITSSSKAAAATTSDTPPRGRAGAIQDEAENRSFSPGKKYIKDPHASLDLYNPPPNDEPERGVNSNPIAPRASAKPAPREHSELFAAGHEDLEPSPGGSPSKKYRESVIAPKGASHRRFESSRLFEEDQDYKEPKIYKTNPARYNHFDLGDPDENDPMQHHEGRTRQREQKHIPLVTRSKRHDSQWDFADFSTPEKYPTRKRPDDVVHFSLNDNPEDEQPTPGKAGAVRKARKDAESHFNLQDDGDTNNNPAAHPKPRRDAETHFDFAEDSTPGPRRTIARSKGAQALYANNQIYDEELEGPPQPLGNITNKVGRKNDFDSQWNVGDSTPAGGRKPTQNRASRKGLESHWDFGDQ